MTKIVGKEVQRIDAYEKVTGKALYGDDLKFYGMLYAANKYTDIPSGKIKKLDISAAEAMPGVVKVALYKDAPAEKRIGPIRRDMFPLVNDQVFHYGDVIAIVAATTKEIANAAADSIKVEYEPVEGIFDPLVAIKKESRLIHPEFKSNVVVHYPLRKGNIEEGFKKSDMVVERVYRTNFHEHAYIEPETVTVAPDPMCRGYQVYGSIQNPFTTRKVVAMYLGVNMNQVNVHGSTMGGSFGGKDDIVNSMACRAALLCMLTGKPVKLTNAREDSMKESYKRHPYIMNYKVGLNKNGKLNAMKIEIVADSGAYSSQSFFVTWRSVVQATGPYEVENVETDIRAVYTNNSYTAAFRGFGSPQIIFAQETLMDELAEMCGLTPLEIRKLNGFKQNSVTASGQVLSEHKVALTEALDKALAESKYNDRIKEYKDKNAQGGRYTYGIGFACSYRGCSLGAEGTDATSAIVSLQADGSAYVLAGLNENGQGLRTTFCQIAAEVLGLKFEKVTFIEPQTASIADGGPTVASRGTLTGGNAVIDAAMQIKRTIFSAISKKLNVEKLEDTVWEDGFIRLVKPVAGVEPMKVEDAIATALAAGLNISAYGWFKAPEVGWIEETGQGNAYFTYVYGCQVAEIKVDNATGKIEVMKVTAAHDVGKAINLTGVKGQIYGGVTQGIGYTVLEDYNIQNGIVKSENLDEYLIPTIKDVGEIVPVIIENEDKYGPFGAKSLGEPTLELTSAAINNALRFATGKHANEIPLTLERVFLGKNLVKPSRSSEAELDCKQRKESPRVSNVTSVVPKDLKEALKLFAEEKLTVMAGGTDVIIHLRKKTKPVKVLSIFNLPELKGIRESEQEIYIGAAVPITEVITHPAVIKHFPLLVQACSLIGSLQIRNRGTMAGNIVNAAPCADSAPPLISYNAIVVVQSVTGERSIPACEFIVKNYKTALEPGEIVTCIVIPKPSKKYLTAYYQLGRRNAVNITRLSVAIKVSLDNSGIVDECSIVAGSLFDRPKSIPEVETIFTGKKLTAELVGSMEEPLKAVIDDAIGTRWSSEYKSPVFINVCKDAMNEILIKSQENSK